MTHMMMTGGICNAVTEQKIVNYLCEGGGWAGSSKGFACPSLRSGPESDANVATYEWDKTTPQ